MKHIAWLATAFLAVSAASPVCGQPWPAQPIQLPKTDVGKPSPTATPYAGALQESPSEAPQQLPAEVHRLPPPVLVEPFPSEDTEPEEVSLKLSRTEQFIANGVERFGDRSPISDIRLPAGQPAGMPQMLAVDSRGQRDVQFFSPPFERPWENTILRPRNHFCHQPLYFEEVNLERYGVRRPVVQPLCSAAHFFGSVAMLPYKMSLDRPMRCYRYPHPYLPGVNGFESQRSLRLAPAVVQATLITGMFLVAP